MERKLRGDGFVSSLNSAVPHAVGLRRAGRLILGQKSRGCRKHGAVRCAAANGLEGPE